ncbi:MAG: hypothetical protein ACRDYE_15975 [Acidimicrobiales bacterium]
MLDIFRCDAMYGFNHRILSPLSEARRDLHERVEILIADPEEWDRYQAGQWAA